MNPHSEPKSLLRHLAEKLLKTRLTSGSRSCQCGRTISANKPACLACVVKHRTISDVLAEQSKHETPGAPVIHVPIPEVSK